MQARCLADVCIIFAAEGGSNGFMKSLSVGKYFEVIHPQYLYLRLTPVKSLRNNNTDKLIGAIASMYRSISRRITKEQQKYFFRCPSKAAFYIYMEHTDAQFYFIIPDTCKTLFKDKIGETWKGITMEQVDALPLLDAPNAAYGLTYKKADAFSLSGDRRSNALLSALMANMDVMENGDRAAVLYNFIPSPQRYWRADYDEAMKKYAQGFPVLKERKSTAYLIGLVGKLIISIGDCLFGAVGDLLGSPISEKPLVLSHAPLSTETHSKRDSRIIHAQIAIATQSENFWRANNAAISICESFDSISGDNELRPVRIPSKAIQSPETYRIKGADILTITPREGQNLIALPGKELIEEHHISAIDTLETEVPAELREGIICIGSNTFKGNEQKAFLTTDKEYSNLALTIIGPTRAGKTTLIENITRDTLKAGECTILLDFCGNCELSKEMIEAIKGPTLDIDLNDFEKLQGIGYNEINSDEKNAFKQYANAKMQAAQLQALIDSTADKNDLTGRMGRYLEASALVAFISGNSIKAVFDCLQSPEVREHLIGQIPALQRDNLSEYVVALRELDDGKGGNRTHMVQGILDRVQRLKQNAYMELMLKRDCTGNFNLLDEVQKPQLICLRMPESMFATQTEKDTYATYWATKIWLAVQLRKRDVPSEKQIRVNLIIDELYQVPHCQDFIREKLSQMAKFRCKMILSCHYLEQISIIRGELKAANTSYMLLAGCDKGNFKELQEELAPYAVEDLLSMKRYYSLNLLKTKDGYARFITKLPPKI
nr:hypothetical protein [Oscillibacter sp.]